MDLLNKRDGHRTLFAFSSYFCVQLAIGGFCYEHVENWTTRARVDVFALERLLFPVNVDKVHWTLAVINLKLRRFEYYDSLGGTNQTALSNLRLWLNEESKAKREVELELSDWEDFYPQGDVPQQSNRCDCGVFTLQFADCIALSLPFDFQQADMPNLRFLVMLQLLKQSLSI